jgi:hypothetical protein
LLTRAILKLGLSPGMNEIAQESDSDSDPDPDFYWLLADDG